MGIVYGDIGTCPLYAFEKVFNNGLNPVSQSDANSPKFFIGGWFPVGLRMLMVLAMAIGYIRYGKQKMKAAISKVKL